MKKKLVEREYFWSTVLCGVCLPPASLITVPKPTTGWGMRVQPAYPPSSVSRGKIQGLNNFTILLCISCRAVRVQERVHFLNDRWQFYYMNKQFDSISEQTWKLICFNDQTCWHLAVTFNDFAAAHWLSSTTAQLHVNETANQMVPESSNRTNVGSPGWVEAEAAELWLTTTTPEEVIT